MNAMIRMGCAHRGHVRGKTSKIRAISIAQTTEAREAGRCRRPREG